MTTMGQLDFGVAQVVSRGTEEVIGYAFTVANGAGQLQRWLLYRDPQNVFELRPPPASMAGWSLSDWQAEVPSLWRPGSFYVWAQSDVYQYGGEHAGETWTQIPPASRLPPPSFPEGVGEAPPFQTWPGVEGVILHVLQAEHPGLIYTVGGLHELSSIEYWMLPDQYQPAGTSAPAGIAPGTEQARSLGEFIDLANGSWRDGCSFVITGCINYHGEHPPAAP